MKIKLNLIIIAFILCYCSAIGQVTGGGAGSGEGNSNRTPAKEDKGVFDNAFYLRTGFSIPVGIFGKKPSPNSNILAIYNGEDGMGAATGGVFEMGTIFYLRNIPLQEQFKVGIDVSWIDVSWNSINWDHLGPGWKENTEVIPFITSSYRIGPAFSYNPIDQLIIDGFYKIGFTTLIGGDISSDYYQDANNSSSFSFESDPGSGIKHSLGVNVRYNLLMLGLEYNTCTITRDTYVNISEEKNGVYSSGSDYYEVETPIKTMRLTFGLKF